MKWQDVVGQVWKWPTSFPAPVSLIFWALGLGQVAIPNCRKASEYSMSLSQRGSQPQVPSDSCRQLEVQNLQVGSHLL